MSDDEFNNISDLFFYSSLEENISNDDRFEGEMFDGMFDDSFTTANRSAISSD